MPILKIDKAYAFEGPEGRASLLDLFAGRRQLILYHFMFAPGAVPWFSSADSDFNSDFGLSRKGHETFGLSAFFRDGDTVYRNYHTSGRGVEMLGSVWSFLDLTVLGRQETWEDSPKGWPQTPPYQWWRRHDEYDT